jgi:hypothetical protein
MIYVPYMTPASYPHLNWILGEEMFQRILSSFSEFFKRSLVTSLYTEHPALNGKKINHISQMQVDIKLCTTSLVR